LDTFLVIIADFCCQEDANAIEFIILKALNCPEPSIVKLAVDGTAKLMVLSGLKKPAVCFWK
jgi:hypothetical protein